MNVTTLEAAFLNKIAHSEFQPVNGATPATFSDTGDVWADCIIEDKQDQGVALSLLNKGLIGHDGYVAGRINGKARNDAGIWLTEAGFAAWQASRT